MENQIQNKTAYEKLPAPVKGIFYLYLALLPLIAFWALYLDKEVWQIFTTVNDSTGKFFYIIFTFVAIFLSGIMSLLIVSVTTLPNRIIPALFMLLDVPIQIAISYLLGNKLRFSEMIILDFMIEIAGITIGIMYLLFHLSSTKSNKKTETVYFWLFIVFGIINLLSFYGTFSSGIVRSLDILSQIPYYTGIITTAGMYMRTLNKHSDLNLDVKDEQVIMMKVGTYAMIALWVSMVLIIFI